MHKRHEKRISYPVTINTELLYEVCIFAPVEDDGVDFDERIAEIHRELLSLQAESNELMDAISQNMKEMGL